MSAPGSPAGRPNSTPAPTLLTLGTVDCSDALLQDQHQLITLLAYLAHNGPSDRQRLATLFWPQAAKPLNNLSSALTRIRRVSNLLVSADRHRVSTPCTTDALELLAELRAGQLEAAESYHGHFLQGFAIKNIGIELEEWIFDIRESIAGVVVGALTERSSAALAAGRVGRAADLAELALSAGADMLDMTGHLEGLYRSLAATNRPSEVRVRSLAHDAGISLVSPLIDDVVPITEPKRDIWGRQNDVADLLDAVRAGAAVNLFGLGGVGKSVLARHLVAQPALRLKFPGAIHVIELQGESDGNRVLSAVFEALDVSPVSDGAVVDLRDSLDQDTLIVLDDLRTGKPDATSPSPAAAIAQLAGHPHLSVLALSRQRLEAAEIKLMPLRGLQVGPTAASPGPAVEYFTECSGPDAVQRAGEQQFANDAFRICQLLSGLPLALELTAAWLRLLPTSEVLSILDDDEMLDEPPPGEDLSLSHVIEQSWDLLPTNTQGALAALAVMSGGFGRRAAREITDIGIRDLTELHDHSLIDIDENGLMRCHPLIQALAKRKLAVNTPLLALLQKRHSEWFMGYLVETLDSSPASSASASMEALTQVVDNLEAAWNSLVSTCDWPAVEKYLSPLDQFLLRSGQIFRAERMYRAVLERLRPAADATTAGLLAAVANNLAWVQMLLANPEDAAAMCDLGLSALPADDIATNIALLRTQCALLGNDGATEAALDGYRQARELADNIDDVRLRALLDEDIGRSHARLGQHDEAIEAYRRTLDSGRLLGDAHMEARSYLMIGLSKIPTDSSHALVLFDEGERLAVANGLTHLLAYFPGDRALAHMGRGEFGQALAEFRRSATLAETAGDLVQRVDSTLGTARAHLRLDDWAAAETAAADGLRLAIRAQLWPPCLGAGLEVAALRLTADRSDERSQRLAAFALAHPKLLVADGAMFAHAIDWSVSPAGAVPPDARLDEVCELILQLFHR